MLKINLNTEIYFELTNYGKKIYDDNMRKWSKLYPTIESFKIYDYPKSMTLWEFMEIFGKYSSMGTNIFVEKNNVFIDDIKLDKY